ncbi:PilC family type IV pilus tip adhesin [Neisseria gonorrhoeae]|uniref:PilC family type IV pilus tip adhesin n=1 Tax=Neisseria gonorrhoeae TaxID=485 RepID=UPI0021DFB5E1|nr:PilC family type IV pilus tip adhesin [Neisseria gonorrhoeae]MCU9817610.1 PilC family type IV pilus tip adhesin [Neisseria gonorrhoeae]MCU9857033.1 PilC family type IV pilus tip adhesin [Neisseria gonorrhoeae]
MNKTLKRQVFRHTALYAAILMFSHTGGGGGAMAQTREYAIIMNGRNQPEVKSSVPYPIKDKDRKRKYTHQNTRGGGGSVSFDNSDELVSRQSGTAVFGTATYLPPYGKVSGFDTDRLKERANAVDWIRTTRIALAGYSYADVVCRSSTGCPKLVYETKFAFGQQGLQRKGSKLDIYEDKSRDNSPIYKLKDHPWLGVSFNLGSENTVKNSKSLNKLISSFSEGNNNQTIVSTTRDHPISLGDSQREHTAVAYYLNAKLHLLDKKGIEDIAQGKIVDLGILKPHVETTGRSFLNFWAQWDIKDNGQIPVKLGLPTVKAGRCINKPNPNPKSALSPALTAPALWFGPAQNGKVQMYSASVSTYPDSSSSKIFLQNLSRNDDKNKPGRYSLKSLNDGEIQSRQPSFNGRQTIIRLDDGVHLIKLNGSKDEVAAFVNLNGNNTGKNDTFGIVKEANVNLDADEWKKVLLPWTVRGPGNDDKFKSINRESDKYSQRYRIRENGNRDLGDIVNSPITAVGGYLATAANDGMVHIFKKNGGSDERSYNLKLSYIPGTVPRQYFDNDTSALKDSTLAQELRTFAEKGYVGDRYGVDGGFVLRQVELRGQKHVFMFGAMGLGGRGAYALDLSKINENYPAAAPLFDVKNGDNNGKNGKNRVEVELGYTVGTPQIGKIRNGTYSAFLASGYAAKEIDDPTNKTALYVYDLKNTLGTPIRKIDVKDGKGGLSSPTLVDKDLDGTVDIAYAGDRGGNMYRFDLSDSNPDKWSVSTIFEGGKPITSAPAVSRLADKRVVIFGTGSDLTEDDVLDTKEQYIYGIFDDDKGTGTVKVTVQNGTAGGLLEQNLMQENKTLFLNKRSDGSGSKGWAVKLTGGQRVTVKPTVVLRTAFVTIRKYNDGGCGAETAILGINTADGGALTPRSARPIVPEANTAVAQYSGHKTTSKGKSIPIGCMEKGGKTVCPNGYVYDKPVNVRYLDETETDGFSTTADGDAGGSGIDPADRRPGKNNRCFSKKGVRTLLMNDLDSLDITGPMCGIKRLSWREVFF